MTVAKNIAYGASALILTGLYPQSALADNFRNKDFLELDNNEKKYFLISTIDTLWQAQAVKDKVIAQCIADWYYKDIANKNGLIEAYMAKYPDSYPSAIVIALTEKACGAYIRVKKAKS